MVHRRRRNAQGQESEQGAILENIKAAIARGETAFQLSSLSLGDVGVHHIVHNVPQVWKMTSLQLMYNDIWADGGIALAKLLSLESCQLENLDLGHNSIGNTGVAHIAKSLQGNMTLTSLFLNDNGIDNEGATYILDALAYNSRLKEVNLTGNPISDRSIIMQIQDRLRINVKQCKMRRIGDEEALKRNVNHLTGELLAEQQKNKKLTNDLANAKNAAKQAHKEYEKQLQDHVDTREKLKVELAVMTEKIETDNTFHRKWCYAEDKNRQLLKDIRDQQKHYYDQIEELRRENTKAGEQVLSMMEENIKITNKVKSLERFASKYDTSRAEQFNVEELTQFEEELEAIIKRIRQVKVQKLKKVNEDLLDSRKCKVCFDESAETILFPCRHLVLCQGCSQKVSKCPLCSTLVESRVRVFEG